MAPRDPAGRPTPPAAWGGQRPRAVVLLLGVALPLALWAVLPLASSGATPEEGKLHRLQSRIESARDKIGAKKGTERVLTTQIAGYSRRIQRLQGRIANLGDRQRRVETDLSVKRAELERLRSDLRAERARVVRLRKRLRVSRGMLRTRLLEVYKSQKPDLVTVILNSDGFTDLLERSEFIRRISDQDRKVVTIVRDARAGAIASERRLASLERRQRSVTEAVRQRRDNISSIRLTLVDTRAGYSQAKSARRTALGTVRGDRRELESELDALEKDSANVRAKLRAAAGPAPVAPGPVRRGSGTLIWPITGALTSPFGPRWGRLHAGIDIAAPGGTPIRAADAGNVVLAGPEGGYGLYTCIQHDATLSTCYAHQSRLGTAVGATVTQGQVMGYVGNTGNSFGDHLHFEVRINGSPVNPIGYL